MITTKSHRAAYETILSMGSLFYSGARMLPAVKLRLFPLVIGPTGVGKSFLVERVARELNADYMKITRGDWLVTGCKAGRPTMYQVLDRLVSQGRVLVHLDELDKFHDLQATEWSACIGTDLWNLLDGKFQVNQYLCETPFPDGAKPSALAIALRIQSRLWIVGSGTWQDVFVRNRPRVAVGFQGTQGGETVDLDVIANSGAVSPELLHRFNGDALFLDYPTPEETAAILESSGIARLARSAGQVVTAGEINWSHGGMRVLETIASRLAIRAQRLNHPCQAMIPFPEDLRTKPA